MSHAHRLVYRRGTDTELPHPGVAVEALLYKPILNAIGAREKRIASELADADAKKSEAQKERDDFQGKNKAFDEQRGALLSKAADEAKVERERLLDEAHKDADSLSALQADALRNDQKGLGSAITNLAKQAIHHIQHQGSLKCFAATCEHDDSQPLVSSTPPISTKSVVIICCFFRCCPLPGFAMKRRSRTTVR